MGSIRVGATCGAIGHAAGIAAALSVKLKTGPRKLHYKEIQKVLKSQDGIFEL